MYREQTLAWAISTVLPAELAPKALFSFRNRSGSSASGAEVDSAAPGAAAPRS